jgi:hypothetical protein
MQSGTSRTEDVRDTALLVLFITLIYIFNYSFIRFNSSVDFMYCDMDAEGQQTTVETLFITAARQTTRDMFSMWSDPSLLCNNGNAVVFYGVWSGTTMWKCFLWGPAQMLYN